MDPNRFSKLQAFFVSPVDGADNGLAIAPEVNK
jgi:hypothetical protein